MGSVYGDLLKAIVMRDNGLIIDKVGREFSNTEIALIKVSSKIFLNTAKASKPL